VSDFDLEPVTEAVADHDSSKLVFTPTVLEIAMLIEIALTIVIAGNNFRRLFNTECGV
jgi:hypothetical protein